MMFFKRNRVEQLLKATPLAPPPPGLRDKIVASIALDRAPAEDAREATSGTGLKAAFIRRRLAYSLALAVALAGPLAYAAHRLYRSFIVVDGFVQYGLYSTVWDRVEMEAPDEAAARRKWEEFKRLYNKGKTREISPGVHAARLSDGEEFSYRGDPNRAGQTEPAELERWKRKVDEIEALRKAKRYTWVYQAPLPELTVNLHDARNYQVSARYILKSGKLLDVGGYDGLREDERARVFSEIAAKRARGEYVRIYVPCALLIGGSDDLRYAFKWGKTLYLRSYEDTYMLADGRLATLAEYEPAEKNAAAFEEIERLRTSGQHRKTYRPAFDITLKGVPHRYLEATYKLADGHEFIVVEYEPGDASKRS